jgi:hypothetical protein
LRSTAETAESAGCRYIADGSGSVHGLPSVCAEEADSLLSLLTVGPVTTRTAECLHPTRVGL